MTGHFGQRKTYEPLEDHFYWPKMRRDVIRFVERCATCHEAKSKLNPHGYILLYLLLKLLGKT